MIFNTDTTLLSSNVAMAEGYDCSIGTALALIDSARNDRAMFEAMLGIEAQACQLEAAGYTNESGEVIALQEAAVGGIFKKIAELFKKLAAKIKAIFHNFFAKVNSLFKSDREMVKKYQKEILRKSNIGNLEVKWRALKHDWIIPTRDVDQAYKTCKWESDKSDRDENMYKAIGADFVDADDVHNSIVDYFLDDEEVLELKEIDGGARGIITDLDSNIPRSINKLQTECDKLIRNIEKEAKECDKKAKQYISDNKGNDNVDDTTFNDNVEKLNHQYDLAISYQDCQLKINNAIIDAVKISYKYEKAAFMKMISANDKKLEESAVWANAIAEAAEDEVTDVLDKAISAEELSEVNNASKAVMDSDVSNDPEKLTYSDDPDYKKASTDGSVDTNIVGTKESAFFGQMFY